jgi:hypothetical protein
VKGWEMNTVLMDVARIGLTASVFIVIMKIITAMFPIPFVSKFFAAV